MARCEDFPCCGHYDEGTRESWCPDPDTGRYPPVNLGPQCSCGMYYDPEDGPCCYDNDNNDDDYCEECDCADPTALAGLAEECDCDCH